MKSAVLNISELTLAHPSYETGLSDVSFVLRPAELLLLHIERENERLPLADAAQGLLIPARGKVQFLDQDWQSMSTDQAAAQRGKIGRLFEEDGWIGDLGVDENILLSQRYHTQRLESDILDEALQLARMFGLPGLPNGRPGSVRRWDLRKAACIRAFLGQPAFIILEQSAHGVFADFMTPLVHAVQSARRWGAAVLWTVTDSQFWNSPAIHATSRARMLGSQLQLVESTS